MMQCEPGLWQAALGRTGRSCASALAVPAAQGRPCRRRRTAARRSARCSQSRCRPSWPTRNSRARPRWQRCAARPPARRRMCAGRRRRPAPGPAQGARGAEQRKAPRPERRDARSVRGPTATRLSWPWMPQAFFWQLEPAGAAADRARARRAPAARACARSRSCRPARPAWRRPRPAAPAAAARAWRAAAAAAARAAWRPRARSPRSCPSYRRRRRWCARALTLTLRAPGRARAQAPRPREHRVRRVACGARATCAACRVSCLWAPACAWCIGLQRRPRSANHGRMQPGRRLHRGTCGS